VFGMIAGLGARRQMDDRPEVPLIRDIIASLRGRRTSSDAGLPRFVEPQPLSGYGKFIVFEGGEGAGKSTQVRRLATALQAYGRSVLVTREPGATPIGARIRSLVLDHHTDDGPPLTPRAEALLYAADRAHHVATVIQPALEQGEIVLCDRYVDSSLAYQGGGRALAFDEVRWLSRWATGGLRPDLVVLLDIDPDDGLRRVSDRGGADRLEAESLAFHRRVRRTFLDLAAADPTRYLVVDATQPIEVIAFAIRERVHALLPPPADALIADDGTPGVVGEPTTGDDGTSAAGGAGSTDRREDRERV
jgi:dTMP kinase